MIYCKKILIVFFLSAAIIPTFAQKGVGINTTNLDDGSALQVESTTGTVVIPRMTTAQMEAIDGPLEGAMVFNTTDNSLYLYVNTKWVRNVQLYDTPSVILNKTGGKLTLQESPPLPLPLNNSHILHNVADYFEVSGTGVDQNKNSTIKVLQEGLYLITAGMSTTNLPAGPKKYKLLVFVNGALQSYLTSGNVNLTKRDYWGSSGNSVLLLEANDVVEIKYTLDGNDTITAKFFNIGISKL
ncbi:hypothetical protein [Marixanthomonas spongiae]|uniref:C1q domain-containing protein n=1 Tax=Marixanthomonas spongiae TaxID=2174845 RepID=A0A2U0HVH7_9FLAO|nr:hypothetical protein [Marixanthomonas spongiae]PVW12855.1 hypothetical protein DDV96_14625 [Marixanthomonas spongiae]